MTACIVCASSRVELVLDLGTTTLANKFLTQDELARPEPSFPLRVGFCRGCGHVQLMEHVPPAAMFSDYLYMSSVSDTLKRHLYSLSDAVVTQFKLGPNNLVIDIGCNDGTLLGGFRRHGVRTLGVDPAENLARLTQGQGVERFIGFFGQDTAPEIVRRWGQAAAITATNTFPHIPNLRGFTRGLLTALAPGGVFVIEAHYLADLLDQGAFDTVYHEHVSYWALGPMIRLFEGTGMQVVHVERLPIHHGQLRVFVQRRGEGEVQPSVARVLDEERARGLNQIETYQRFAEAVQDNKRRLREALAGLRAQGKRIAGYGAPAKGNTLLTFLELGPDMIEYIADKSLLKQGRYTPGTHIPVVPPVRLLEDQPDYVVLLAWNFADEILSQQAEYRRRGGQFIVPVPEVRIVQATDTASSLVTTAEAT